MTVQTVGREGLTLAVGVSRVEIEGKLMVRSLQDQEQLKRCNTWKELWEERLGGLTH